MKTSTYKWINIIIFALNAIILTLSITGLVNYGVGLGNIMYIFLLMLIILLHAVLAVIGIKRNEKYKLVILSVFSILLLWIMYSATFGRGPEYRWNGKIFYYPTKRNANAFEIDSVNKSTEK